MTELQVVEPTTDLVKIESQPSFLRLIQPMSEALPGRPGQIYDSATKEVYDSLTVAVIRRGIKRDKWADNERRSQYPICKSSDGRVPDPIVEHPLSPSCDICPYAIERFFKGKQLQVANVRPCKRAQAVQVVALETKRRHTLECGGLSDDRAFDAMADLDAIVAKYNKRTTAYQLDFIFHVDSVRIKGVYAFNFRGPEPNLQEDEFGPLYQEELARYS